MNRQTWWIISSIPLLVINSLIFVPFLIWCIIQIRRHWRDEFFSTRRPILIISFVVSLSIYHVGDSLVYFLYLVRYNSDTTELIYDIAYSCAFYPMKSMAESVIVMRIWLLFFDSNVSRLIKNQNWQQSINPQIGLEDETQRAFYLNPKSQRKWAGNGSFLFKIACLVLLCETILYSFIFAFVGARVHSVAVENTSFVIKVKYLYWFGIFCHAVCHLL